MVISLLNRTILRQVSRHIFIKMKPSFIKPSYSYASLYINEKASVVASKCANRKYITNI